MTARARTPDRNTRMFVEKLAVLLETDGMPRVAGRLFGLLLVSAEPRSLDELAKQLGLSKASISINARLLEEKGLVERVGRQADRRDYYRIAEDILERTLEQRSAKIRRFQQASHVRSAAIPRRRCRSETRRGWRRSRAARPWPPTTAPSRRAVALWRVARRCCRT